MRLHLEHSGMPIGPNDMLIAAHAPASEASLVTANVSAFLRVHGRARENWLEAMPGA